MSEEIAFYRRKLFWWCCGAPVLISSFYLFIWATPRYESQAIVRIYQGGEGASTSPGGGAGDVASPGPYIFAKYISSWDIFQSLDPEYLKKHWTNGDWPSSFGGPLSLFSKNKMKLWRYYKAHVKTDIDEMSGLVSIKIDGYSADFVWDLNKKILALASQKLTESGIKADQEENKLLSNKIEKDNTALLEHLNAISFLQRTTSILNIRDEYLALSNALNQIETQRLLINTHAAATSFLAEKGQQIEVLKTQLNSLNQEIQKQHDRIAKNSDLYRKYTFLEDNIQQDSRMIMLDEESLLTNEQNSVRHAYYIDFIENPVYPTDATIPRSLMWVSIIFVSLFFIYLIIK